MEGWTEKDLFKYLKDTIYPDLVKSSNPMSRWDCYSPRTQDRIELKCRGVHYDTLLIERKKYDGMLYSCRSNLDTPMYINSTPRGVYRFNLFLIDPKWEVQYHNKTTQFSQTQKIAKIIAMLNVKDAEIL